MKMISARSSNPPMMLPIRIHREIGMARPFNTSSMVYQEMVVGVKLSKENANLVLSHNSAAVFLPPSRHFLCQE